MSMKIMNQVTKNIYGNEQGKFFPTHGAKGTLGKFLVGTGQKINLIKKSPQNR